MQTPADKTAKRLSQREWLERYDMSNIIEFKQPTLERRTRLQARAPADRVAVRT